ncbi:MAG: energy transducer TonB [Nitrospira sp. CG24E]|nr:MAG: energy transducer TonB [Nitrospira sp. CG24E]
MTLSSNGQYRAQGWVVSALVHGLALTVALGFITQVKPVLPTEVFTWDVALVEPQQHQETHQAEIKPVQESAQPTPRPVAPAPIRPQPIAQEVQVPKVTTVVQREIPQVVETSEPIQQMVAAPQPVEVEQTTQSLVESVAPVVQPEAAPAEPSIAATSATAAIADAKPAESVAQEPPLQVAPVTRSVSAVKVDHGWLAESLRRRLAEIKRYPSAARLNGWEGKVVLRAVIRADGHLSEVKVHRSSGYETLDNAAMEAIRLVCPLHMTKAMDAAEVAVYVPMVYSLGS